MLTTDHKDFECKFKASYCKIFLEKRIISRMTMHPHRVPNLHEWKITKKIPGMTWPAQSLHMNIIENLQNTIKLKLQSEIDMDVMHAALTNAVCKC